MGAKVPVPFAPKKEVFGKTNPDITLEQILKN
jgi:hypothetical protein